jgi:glycosyltransferase involved in cell wall biosynthesis
MVISTPFPPKEGIGYYVYNLSKNLIRIGHKVTVVTRGNWYKTEREDIDGINLIRVQYLPLYPFYLYFHGYFVNRMFKSIESEIDIVHIHSPLVPPINTQRPIITTIHTPMLTDAQYTKVSSLFTLLTKISARFVSYPLELKHIESSSTITTVSKSIANELKEYYLDLNEVVVTGNGVDIDVFKPLQKKSSRNKKYILYVGHIDREKGLFDLLECAKDVCNVLKDVTFLIAGSGRDLNSLKRKTKKLGLTQRVKFLGQIEKKEVVNLYQDVDLFVFPSYHEGLPTALLEAMSCGLPVIATDVRGNREIISDKKNGIIVPPRNPKKLAETIIMLMDDAKLRKTISINAKETVRKNYSWDAITDKYINLYKLLYNKN